MVHNLQYPPESFGTLLGSAPGDVAMYSSHYASANKQEYPDHESYRSYLDGVYMGYKWQCVEFARRWLYLNHGYVFDDVAMAYDIFGLTYVTCTADDRLLPLYSFKNGSQRAPEPGCMLIWQEGGEFDVTGHVAIVTEVLADRVRVAEQNVEHVCLPEGQSWCRELALSRTEADGYWITEVFPDTHILGWVLQTSDPRHAVRHQPGDAKLLNLNTALASQSGQHEQPWLNLDDAAESAYVKALKGHRLSESEDIREHYRYFRMSESAEQELIRATNELHHMFMHATQVVLHNDALLQRFNIPASLWPRLRKSWSNRHGQMITGRFDFCLSERGLKVYEYNCDSASCHMEAGRVQGLWAQHFGVSEGKDAGQGLSKALRMAWQQSDVDGLLHIMQDTVSEETYHARFIQAAAEAAGIPCKIIKGVQGLAWNDRGEIIDADGKVIRFVWKTWAWETALDQIRTECEEDDCRLALRTGSEPSQKPRLVDVLLRPEVLVYEPFWSLIPSNKAILPILWQIFPDHPYLLNSQFELDEAFHQRGYVTKPIAGRCGFNISLYDRHDRLMNETEGRFDQQDQIYQELWKLPDIDGYRTQLCTFTGRGKYAGSCVRVDKSLIITTNSELLPLRIVPDDTLV